MAESIISSIELAFGFLVVHVDYVFAIAGLYAIALLVYHVLPVLARRLTRGSSTPKAITVIAALVLLCGCASGHPWTDHKITLDPSQTIELSSYQTRLYACPGDHLVLACSSIGGGGRVGYVRCGCALSTTVDTLR